MFGVHLLNTKIFYLEKRYSLTLFTLYIENICILHLFVKIAILSIRRFTTGKNEKKKYIPFISLPWNLQVKSSWSKKYELYFRNYNFSEYVKFGAISWKSDILSITA